jgi:feruloyl esterase
MKVHHVIPTTALLVCMLGISSDPVLAQVESRPCDALGSSTIADTTIASAQFVSAGTFKPPQGAASTPPAAFSDLSAFCRVAGTTRVLNSDVRFELWMPMSGWNGDLQPAGSSFWGGSIPFDRMGAIVRTGAATIGTNLGIEGFTGPSFALEHASKLENLKMDPLHAVIERGKTLMARFYGSGPRLTVMDECGGGGSRDVMALVQRFPTDLDAAVSVNFTNYGTRHGVSQMWLHDATHRTPASVVPTTKLPMIHQAVLDACDGLDGVNDGVLENPRRCKFDPTVLQCKGADAPNCLTAAQVESVRRIYETPRHARTKEPIYGPMERGSELGWGDMIGNPEPYRYAQAFYRYMIFKDPGWAYAPGAVNFDSDIDKAESAANRAINHTNPDLTRFVERGGKLLLVGGWVDDLPPQNVLSYYENVVKTMGDRASNGVRLFMVPGMHHCFGGTFPGAYKVDFDAVGAIKQWKATGTAPEQIVVTTSGPGWPTRPRLVCAYPKVSTFTGSGSTDDPRNFACAAP